jgi:hypothetical protein
MCGAHVSGPVALPPDDEFPAARCSSGASLELNVDIVGLPTAGSFVTVDARKSKVAVREVDCDVFYTNVPSLAWRLIAKPTGSTSALAPTVDDRVVTVPLDLAGDYVVEYSACPSGCTVEGFSLATKRIAQTIDVSLRGVRPPETVPALPASARAPTAPTSSDAASKCNIGAAVTAPQWVTVDTWLGPQFYRTLEGWVTEAHMSGSDNFMNHDGELHDVNTFVTPDPKFNSLFWKELPSPSD